MLRIKHFRQVSQKSSVKRYEYLKKLPLKTCTQFLRNNSFSKKIDFLRIEHNEQTVRDKRM